MERPTRLHHHAFVSSDLEATRTFYEDIVGLPLVATWCEIEFGAEYCHVFFELEDGSCLAFFQFADPATNAEHTQQASESPFDHVALAASADFQSALAGRARAAGIETTLVDHGYCVSLYLRDPDGLIVEFTVDNPDAVAAAGALREKAHGELARWLAGDRTDNNNFRTATEA